MGEGVACLFEVSEFRQKSQEPRGAEFQHPLLLLLLLPKEYVYKSIIFAG